MGKYKTSYSTDWQKSFKWLRKCSDRASASCKICDLEFKIDNGGLSQVKSHAKSKKHLTLSTTLAGQSTQSTFRVGHNAQLEMSKGNSRI